MKNKFNIKDRVTYLGSDDEWSHESCVGFEYVVDRVHPSVGGVYYYDLSLLAPINIHSDNFVGQYNDLFSVPEYQLK